MSAEKKSKGEATRILILETALRLFRERGFEETTMRSIADEAGVAVGNAYYYFSSKDDMVHAFYARVQGEQVAVSESVLATEKSFKNRLTGCIRAQLAIITPYHKLFISLFRIAADPDSKLNPFHEDTKELRDACIAHFQNILSGSEERVPTDLQQELPFLLWMYYMGIILFWLYDRSPSFVRTYKLLELSAEVIANLLNLAGMPLMAPARRTMLNLITSIRQI